MTNAFIRNVRTASFKAQFNRLPQNIQQLAVDAFARFLENPADPSLRHHPLGDNKKGQHREGSFSVSITMRYRAVYTRDGNVNVWYWIGKHSDYDAFIGRK